jgi:O-antigen biosynthesis protein
LSRSILVVDDWYPRPDRDSGSLRMRRLLAVLADLGWRVAFAARTPLPGHEEPLAAAGIAVVAPDTPVERHLAAAGSGYDAVLLSRPDVAAAYLPAVRRHAPQATVIYDSVDLYFVREYRQARLLGSRARLEQALARRRQELSIVRAVDRTLVVSAVERDLLGEECPGAPVHVVSNIHTAAGSQRPFDDRRDVVFVGNFAHEPNVDAALHLLEEVWPRTHEQLEDARLLVVGADPPEAVRERAGERAAVTGHVADLSALLDSCRLTVAPLRFGAGVKGKVLESLARGVPVVGSSIAFEGLPVVAGEDVVVADDPVAAADAVARVHDDPVLWERLSRAGPRVVSRGFSYAAARRALADALAPDKAPAHAEVAARA